MEQNSSTPDKDVSEFIETKRKEISEISDSIQKTIESLNSNAVSNRTLKDLTELYLAVRFYKENLSFFTEVTSKTMSSQRNTIIERLDNHCSMLDNELKTLLANYYSISISNSKEKKSFFISMLKKHKFFSENHHLSITEYKIWSDINNKNRRFTAEMMNQDVFKYYETVVSSFKDSKGVNFRSLFRDEIKKKLKSEESYLSEEQTNN